MNNNRGKSVHFTYCTLYNIDFECFLVFPVSCAGSVIANFIKSIRIYRSKVLLEMQEFMKPFIFVIRRNGFLIRSTEKPLGNRKIRKWKTSIFDGLSNINQKFSKIDFSYGNKNLAEITHFSRNKGLKFPRLG